ncbi:hypothetical protein DFH27DRAFT_631188 [Peziza echinospora]|nr:hypothetical protein DFH27DRAFT_631188 [Peziza echinospora]
MAFFSRAMDIARSIGKNSKNPLITAPHPVVYAEDFYPLIMATFIITISFQSTPPQLRTLPVSLAYRSSWPILTFREVLAETQGFGATIMQKVSAYEAAGWWGHAHALKQLLDAAISLTSNLHFQMNLLSHEDGFTVSPKSSFSREGNVYHNLGLTIRVDGRDLTITPLMIVAGLAQYAATFLLPHGVPPRRPLQMDHPEIDVSPLNQGLTWVQIDARRTDADMYAYVIECPPVLGPLSQTEGQIISVKALNGEDLPLLEEIEQASYKADALSGMVPHIVRYIHD